MPLRLVVPDASSLGAGLFNEPNSPRARPLIAAITRQEVIAVAPALLVAEFVSICQKKRAGNIPITPAIIDSILEDFLRLPIIYESLEDHARDAWSLHRPGGVDSPDVFYLECALRNDAELWTGDRGLHSQGRLIHPRTFSLFTNEFRL